MNHKSMILWWCHFNLDTFHGKGTMNLASSAYKCYCSLHGLPGQPSETNSWLPQYFFSQNGHCAITKQACFWMSFLIVTTFKDELAVVLMPMGFIWLYHSNGWIPLPATVLLFCGDVSGEPPNIWAWHRGSRKVGCFILKWEYTC